VREPIGAGGDSKGARGRVIGSERLGFSIRRLIVFASPWKPRQRDDYPTTGSAGPLARIRSPPVDVALRPTRRKGCRRCSLAGGRYHETDGLVLRGLHSARRHGRAGEGGCHLQQLRFWRYTSADVALQYTSDPSAVTFGLRDAGGPSMGPGELLQSFTGSNLPGMFPGAVVTFNATAPLILTARTFYWLTSEAFPPGRPDRVLAGKQHRHYHDPTRRHEHRAMDDPLLFTPSPAFRINC
jgi:hypothetical protein